MNPNATVAINSIATLALIGDLYQQIANLQAENSELKAEKESNANQSGEDHVD